MKRMKEVLEKVYNDPKLRKTIVPLFIGNPGLGKTKIIEDFAKEKGIKIVDFITSQRNPFEISGMAMPDKDLKKMSIWDFDDMLNLKDGDILFFDEVLNGYPVVLNACLTLLESRKMISGKKLPDVMIVAAANPQGMMPLTPQIKERFVWYNVSFDRESWKKYMSDKYMIPDFIAKLLCRVVQQENFENESNFSTPRSIDKAVEMLIKKVPTPYIEKDELMVALNTIVTNTAGEDIVLSNGDIIKKDERIPWLRLAQLGAYEEAFNINITETTPSSEKNPAESHRPA